MKNLLLENQTLTIEVLKDLVKEHNEKNRNLKEIKKDVEEIYYGCGGTLEDILKHLADIYKIEGEEIKLKIIKDLSFRFHLWLHTHPGFTTKDYNIHTN